MTIIRLKKSTLKYAIFLFILLSISFFRVQVVSAFYKNNYTSNIDFTTATYQNLTISTDRTSYGLCGRSATILFTIGNSNSYNIGYTITFNNADLTYTIDGVSASSYTLPAGGSKTHTIVINGTTSTTSLDIIVTPNNPYASSHSKNVTLDLVCPVCTWGTLPDLTATLTNNYVLTCTDVYGIVSKVLTTSDITSSDTTKATVTGISAPTTVTDGFKYTITATGVAYGTFTLKLEAGLISDNNSNVNIVRTSNSINVVKKIPELTTQTNSLTFTYGDAAADITYTYSGNAAPTVTSSVPEVATFSIDTVNKKIRITPGTVGNTVITLSAQETNQYTAVSKTINVEVVQKNVTYTAGSTYKTYDGIALALPNTCSITAGNLVSGHTATCTNTGTITNYTSGGVTNTLSAVVIRDANSNDVTSNYDITRLNGILTINKRATTITAGSSNRPYNGSALTNTGCTGTNLVSGQTITCTMSTGSTITNVGSVENIISTATIYSGSNDTTGNYSLTNVNGTLGITRSLTATTGSCASLTYNGSAQTLASGASNASYTNNSGTNATSYTVTVTSGSNYAFNDGATSKTLSCSIGKRTCNLTLSATSGSVYVGSSITFTERSTNCAGSFTNTSSGNNNYATVSPTSYSGIGVNSAQTVTVYGMSNGTTTATITFTPTDTANNNGTSATYSITAVIPARTYTVTFYKNGAASIGGSTAEYVTRTCTIAAGNTATTCSITSPTISGTSSTPNVIGWDLDNPSGHTNDLSQNTAVIISGDRTYYAQTSSSAITYWATFSRNGASSINWTASDISLSCTIAATYNGVARDSSCYVTTPTIERSGYSICGWAPTATKPTSITKVSTSLALSSNIILYAITGKIYSNLISSTVGSGDGLYNVDAFAAAAEGVKYMYRGIDPSNYIKFNCSNEPAADGCQTWRILSVEQVGLNNATYVIEIVYPNNIYKSKWNNSSTTTYWYGSDIKAYVENLYNNMYAGSKSRIVSAYYYNRTLKATTYGGSSTTTLQQTAEEEVVTANPYMIGIPRVTDYLITGRKTAYNSKWGANLSSNGDQATENWLRTTASGSDYWFISKHDAAKCRTQNPDGGGVSAQKVGTSASLNVYPVVHLDNGVFLLGSGTSSDPYYVCPICMTKPTCSVTTQSGFVVPSTGKVLTINAYTNGGSLHGSPYSWDNYNWGTGNTTTVTAAGTYKGYIRDASGQSMSCSIIIKSRTEYRTRACTSGSYTAWRPYSSSLSCSNNCTAGTTAYFRTSCNTAAGSECGDIGCMLNRCYETVVETRSYSCNAWGGWSDWTATSSSPSSSLQVETRTTIGV